MGWSLCEELSVQMRLRKCGAEGFKRSPYANYVVPPYIEPPPGFQPFDFNNVIVTPAAGSSAAVLQWIVPKGWDGVITNIAHQYFPGGFSEGSGDIIWRIRIDGQFVKNYQSILVTFGSLDQGRAVPGGIQINAGQTIEYVIEIPPASPVATGPGNNTYASASGWYWPRGE